MHMQLPVFDASKKTDGFQKAEVRLALKRRRQKRVVGFIGAAAQKQASETGSWRRETNRRRNTGVSGKE
jgi:hypothetical protein